MRKGVRDREKMTNTHTSYTNTAQAAYVSIRQHTSAYVSIRAAYVSIPYTNTAQTQTEIPFFNKTEGS